MTDPKLQRMNLWVAVAGLLFTGIGAYPLAGLVPPHPPSSSAEQIVAFWAEDTDIKRLGVISLLIGLGLAISLPVAIFLQMRRVCGPDSPLPWLQLCAGLLSYVPGFIAFLSWEVLAFRPDRGDPSFVLGLNDLAWFSFLSTTVAWVQSMAIAICAFQDKDQKVFPRWSGYLSLWVSVTFLPAVFIVYFKSGPLAWNGLITWWAALAVFGSWLGAMVLIMFRAVASQEAEEASASLPVGGAAS